jgi:hypothetical protein
VLGEQLDLFSFHEEAPGFVLHPRRRLFRSRGLHAQPDPPPRLPEVKAPLVLSDSSGTRPGTENYLENMFFTAEARRARSDRRHEVEGSGRWR